MKTIILDFKGCGSKEAVHADIKEEFGFPEYYGRNLDALYDCLCDIPEDTRVIFAGAPEDEPVQKYLEKVRRVFNDAAEENSHLYL